MDRIIKKARRLTGIINVSGDKSISHRALMLGAIAEGTTEIRNISYGKDVKSTWDCLTKLGVSIRKEEDRVFVEGKGLYGLTPPKTELDAGNSGTTMRLLTGILAGQSFQSILTGDQSLTRRPMSRIIEPLKLMGACIEPTPGGFAPLKISGKTLHGISYSSPVASAQVKSCIIMAGLYASGVTSVHEPQVSRDHTERMLPCFEVDVVRDGLSVNVHGQAKLKSAQIDIPGDISSAAFFMAGASLIKDSKICLQNIGINKTRTGIIDILKNMGANIDINRVREINREDRADIAVEFHKLKALTIGGALIPLVIDELPVLAIAATQAEGVTVVTGAKELRVKESDRIKAVVQNLKAMGADAEELEDGFRIPGPRKLLGAEIESFGDHRIAMAFAIAGLLAEGETIIKDSECVDISLPGFFEILDRVSHDRLI